MSTLSAKETSPVQSKIPKKRKIVSGNGDSNEFHFSKDEVIQVESDEFNDDECNHLGDIPVALQVRSS